MLSIFGLTLAMNVYAADPESFIPEKASIIARFDAKRMLQDIQNRSEMDKAQISADFKKFMSEFQAMVGVPLTDVFASDVWAAGIDEFQGSALYAKTPVTEAKMAELTQMACNNNDDIEYSEAAVGGKKVYIVTCKEKEQAMAMVYVASDVVLFTTYDSDTAAVLSASAAGGKNPLLEKINRQTLIAAVVNVKELGVPDLGNVNYAKFTFDCVGAEKKDIFIQLDLECQDKTTARNMAMQAQMAVPSLICMPFGDNEELAMAMASGFKVKANDNTVIATYSLPEPLMIKAVTYLTDPAKRQEFNPQDSVNP